MTDISELIERLEANMGKADIGDVLKDCRLAAAALRQSSELSREASERADRYHEENNELFKRAVEAEQKNIDWAKGNCVRTRETIRTEIRQAELVSALEDARAFMVEMKARHGDSGVGILIRAADKALASVVSSPSQGGGR